MGNRKAPQITFVNLKLEVWIVNVLMYISTYFTFIKDCFFYDKYSEVLEILEKKILNIKENLKFTG